MTASPTISALDEESVLGLYATWAGHRHPLSPRSPVPFEDLAKLKVFYRATFEGAGPGRRIVLFDKFRIDVRYLHDQDFPSDGSCYTALEIGNDQFQAGVRQNPDEALAAGRWVAPSGRGPREGQLITVIRLSSTRYSYRASGELENVAIEDALGSRVIRA